MPVIRTTLISALTALFSVLVMAAGTAEAQNGYRGYIGPSSDVYAKDAYAPISRNVPPGVISLGYDFINSSKGQAMLSEARKYVVEHPKARYLLSEADDYVHSPMAKHHLKRVKKYVNNPKNYRTVERAQRFLMVPSDRRDELLGQVSSGKNFDFMAGNTIGYLRTGQVDVRGNEMIVYQGGTLESQTYKVRTKPTGQMIIESPEGPLVGLLEQKGDKGSIRLMSHGLAVPISITNFMPRVDDHK